MTKQTLQIPTKCSECINTDFQIDNCPYQCVNDLKELISEFERLYGIDLLKFGLNITPIVQKAREGTQKCLKTMDQRVQQIAFEQEQKERDEQMKTMQETIKTLSDKFTEILANQSKTQIFREQQQVKSPMKSVQKNKSVIIPKKSEEEPQTPSLVPFGSWKVDQRNIKEENIPKFLKQLKEKHPELSNEVDLVLNGQESEAVRVEDNNSNNKMIRYRDMVDPLTIK